MPQGIISKDDRLASFAALSRDITSYLKFLSQSGATGVDCSKKTLDIIRCWDLTEIFLDMVACKNCRLGDYRKITVNGMGDFNAKLMIVCGMPEPEDAHTGYPLSGRQGELLNRILVAMKLNRESAYITPAVKCCAPEAPESATQQIKGCRNFLLKEIAFVRPKIICAFGRLASSALLDIPLPIQRLRGRFYTCQGIQVMPTFSLDHLIQRPEDKRAAWEDIKLVMRQYEKYA